MAITADHANQLLNSISSEEQLRDLISQLDVSATGDVTILYSGDVTDTIRSSDIINSMINSGQSVRVIDNTQAYDFLQVQTNQTLNDTLVRIFGDNPRLRGTRANQFLFGTRDANGVRSPDGAWDIVSSNFARETTGPVRAIVPNAPSDGVFALTELNTLLDESGFTELDGTPRADLEALRVNNGHDAIFNKITTESFFQVNLTDLSANNPESINRYLSLDPGDNAAGYTAMLRDADTFARVDSAISNLPPSALPRCKKR